MKSWRRAVFAFSPSHGAATIATSTTATPSSASPHWPTLLVPRPLTWLGLIGGPLLLVESLGVLFDWWERAGAVALLVAPEFLWELLLGIYAAIWGFRRAAPILSGREQ